MSFNAKNPMTAPKIEKTPPLPLNGARGLFPTPEGWNDINDDGSVEKLGYAKDGIIDVVGTFERTNDWDQFRIYDKYGKEVTDALEAHNGIFRAKAVYEFVEHEREFFFIQGTYHDAFIGRIYVWQYFFTNDNITEKKITIHESDEGTYPITDEVYASNVNYGVISLGDYVLAKHDLENHLADSDIHVTSEDKTNFIIDVGVHDDIGMYNFRIYDKYGKEATSVLDAHTGLFKWKTTFESMRVSIDYIVLQVVDIWDFHGNSTVSQYFFSPDGRVYLRRIPVNGDLKYEITEEHYNNEEWSEYDLYQLEEVFAQLRVDIDAHTSNTDIHVTTEDKDNWNDKYTKEETHALVETAKNNLSSEIEETSENLQSNIAENKEDILTNARDIENMKITNTTTGSVITTTDSAETGLAGLRVYGKSEQFSTTGKNELNEKTIAPISVNISGTKRYGWDLGVLPQGDYTLTVYGNYSTTKPISYKIITNESYSDYVSLSETVKYKNITLNGTQGLIVYLFENETSLPDNVTLQLEKGLVSTPYEPYTGGIASPNPNYPQEITSVGDSGSVDLKLQGKNWLPYPYHETTLTRNGITYTDNGDGSFTVSGTATGNGAIYLWMGGVIPFVHGQTYRKICNHEACALLIHYLDDNGTSVYLSNNGNFVWKDSYTLKHIYLQVSKGYTASGTVYPIIVEGSSYDGVWEPPKPLQSATFTAPNGLRGIPEVNACDEIDSEKGVRVQRIYKNVLDGTEKWQLYTETNLNQFYIANLNNNSLPAPIVDADKICCICEDYRAIPLNLRLNNYYSVYMASTGVCFHDPNYTTIEDWKAMLVKRYADGNPLTVWYALATPIETPLTDEEIAAYKALHTYKPNTTIYNSEGADMSVDYAVDPQIYIDRADEFSRVSDNVSYDNSISGLVSDNVQDAIDEVMVKVAGIADLSTDSWENIQKIVRLGLAPKVFSIGDQFIVNKDGKELVWDIIGFDHDTPVDSQYKHSMTLQLHDCYRDFAFDSGEALYYCEEELPAGTYYFTIQNYDAAYGGNKSYYFTLVNSVPAGGQVDFRWDWQKQVTECKINTYSGATSTTVIESVGLTEGTEGTFLGVTDGTYENLNHIHRARYGHNRWTYSGLRDWLNTDAEANTWWKPYHKFDRPHTHRNVAGFLSGMDADFLSVISKVKKRTALNTVTDGGGYEDTEEFMFLLSRSEVFGGLENNINEGEPYAYYKDYSDLTSAGVGADTNRIKYLSGVAKYWWLRSAYYANGSYVRRVDPSGAVSHTIAYSSYGVAPACTIA